MELKKEHLNLPALPMVGMAGILLGEKVDSLIERLGKPERVTKSGTSAFIRYPCLHFVADSDLIVEIYGAKGYVGFGPGGIHIGMPWTEVIRKFPNIRFHSNAGVASWYIPGIDGFQISAAIDVNGRSVDQMYELSNPGSAFVSKIAVNRNIFSEIPLDD